MTAARRALSDVAPADASAIAVRLRIVTAGGVVAIGPGKADLLEAIAATGSISEAARTMDMSYRRAWGLVRTMNGAFAEPLVASAPGGPGGGGATLTPAGRRALALYRRAQAKAARSAEADAKAIQALLG